MACRKRRHNLNANEATLHKLYDAFERHDPAALSECYHNTAIFSNPIFVELYGLEVPAMWHMLMTCFKDLKIRYRNISADANGGSADWEAMYRFRTPRGARNVHNYMHANFMFRDGKIVHQVDEFSFWQWARMALGTSGFLFGWTFIVRNQVRATALKSLRQFINQNPDYQSVGMSIQTSFHD